jgi:hypothetical protein
MNSVARRRDDAWSGDGSPAEGAGISVTEPVPRSAKRMALSRGMVVVIGQALERRNVSVLGTCRR